VIVNAGESMTTRRPPTHDAVGEIHRVRDALLGSAQRRPRLPSQLAGGFHGRQPVGIGAAQILKRLKLL